MTRLQKIKTEIYPDFKGAFWGHLCLQPQDFLRLMRFLATVILLWYRPKKLSSEINARHNFRAAEKILMPKKMNVVK